MSIINNNHQLFEEERSKRPKDVLARIKFGLFLLVILFLLLFFVVRIRG